MSEENKKSGFVPLWRSMLKWEWHDDANVLSVWVHLLLMASFHPSKWRGIEIEPGQVITSVAKLCTNTGLSTRQVRTALEKLEKTREIDKQTTNKLTIVTICNYASYAIQNCTSDKQTTNKRQTNDKQTTNKRQHSKNVNNVNNVKQEDIGGEKSPFSPSFKKWTIEEFSSDLETACIGRLDLLAVSEEFKSYWTEKGARLMKFQYEKTWETKRRIEKWLANHQQWQSEKMKAKKPNCNGHGEIGGPDF